MQPTLVPPTITPTLRLAPPAYCVRFQVEGAIAPQFSAHFSKRRHAETLAIVLRRQARILWVDVGQVDGGEALSETQPGLPRLLGVFEMAAALNTISTTLERWVRQGKIPPPIRFLEARYGWLAEDLDAARASTGRATGREDTVCRHCQRVRANRPRGLCWACYYKSGVKDQYCSTSKFARRGVEDCYGAVLLPLEPTQAQPGSPEKVAVLEERARLRQALWHPGDAPMDTESRTLGIR